MNNEKLRLMRMLTPVLVALVVMAIIGLLSLFSSCNEPDHIIIIDTWVCPVDGGCVDAGEDGP